MLPTDKELIKIILSDEWMMAILKKHTELNLPDSWIGAGFVRNKVWDLLHHYKERTPLNDIDIIYFDKSDNVNSKEQENKFGAYFPELKFSFKNQAIMHKKHGHACYQNSEDSISHWVETATAVAIRWNGKELEYLAPYGLKDLFSLALNPTDLSKTEVSKQRVEEKRWLELWPRLILMYNV